MAPRRLEVIENRSSPGGAIIVRLPSGVSIEFGGGAGLTQELLTAFATLEVRDVASR
jgi:hypothetical protein